MRSSIVILLSVLAVAGASPTLPPRACTTIFPSNFSSLTNTPVNPFTQPLDKTNTDVTLVALLDSPHLRLQHLQGSDNASQDSLQFVDFQIPAGANTCQVSIADNANKLYFEKDSNTSAVPPTLSFISLIPGALCEDPQYENVTYDDVMHASPSVIQSSQWGTAALTRGTSEVVNSFPCPQPTSDGEDGHAQFVIEFEPDQMGEGSCYWVLPQSTSDVGVLDVINGIYLTYC
ncbi:hypothetical protein N431DRAFT_541372 [Stipitochalara longipes BDJ]|nr:hypothetical protein N431DRAFT_541372 [Stipitochalara longipes BDJ]